MHIPGATFSHLRTVECEEFETFKEACITLRLIDNDNELQDTLTEVATYQMPRQLLNMLAIICLFNQLVNALHLWNENKEFMIEFMLRNDNTTAENIALHLRNAIFGENGLHCSMLGLPEPVGEPPKNKNNTEQRIVNPNLLNIE
ncbi:Hypothetical predicted protein [Octopus vulgaris]|uniref:Uncharacterized protein n=1 Tax=Octopus vulgaris TaxID=6645 RepID=A0AA36EX12_OCTVU|nr:Hypothetical predicted protein [Octopus vulgaris]